MATFSRVVSVRDALDYALDCAALALGMAVVPTLAAAAGREPLPSWPTLPLSVRFLQEHLCVRAAGIPSERWYTALSHIACHMDATHRHDNICALVLTGWLPWSVFGRAGWLATLLTGAAVAALDPFHSRQEQIRAYIDAQSGRVLPGGITSGAARWWAACDGNYMCGASAAACSLLGAEVCLTIERALALYRAWRRRPDDPSLLVPIGVHALSIYHSAAYVLAEHRSLTSGASLTVNHSAHLVGVGVGVGCYVVYRLLRQRESGAPRPQLFGRARRDTGRRLGGGGGNRLGGRADRPGLVAR